MLRQLLFGLVTLVLASTYLHAQSEDGPNAYAFRFIGVNHLWPQENVEDFSRDDFRPGLEFEYFRYLNNLLDFSLPVRLASTRTATDELGVNTRTGFDLGANALLNLNIYKGRVFRPRLFAGVGATAFDLDGVSLDAPVGLGLNFFLGRNTSLGTTFAYHFNSEEFHNHLQAGLGLRIHLEDAEPKLPEVTDRDGDGINDDEDLCPDTPGVIAFNGCPDTDGDGIADSSDDCPTVAGIAAFNGCPDTDGDGLKDGDDKCPEEAGPIDNEGCPVTDRDGDGISDASDACPDEPGPAATNGCPAKALTITARDKTTNETIPGVQVEVRDASGNVVQSGITDANGQLKIASVTPGQYTVGGKILDIDMSQANLSASDFGSSSGAAATIFYDDPNFIIQGKVYYCNSTRPLSDVNLNLRDKAANGLKTTRSDGNGSYTFYLDNRSTYELYAQKESFLSQVVEINPADYNRNTSVFVRLEVCADEVECGEAVRLDNILYDTGSAAIRPDARPDLERVVQFLRDNKDAKVELSSHTDSRGRASSNQSLSQRRADSAANYIKSQGISASRVIATGYGETRLLNECADGVSCSNAQHQVNRRTEFKVICPD
ncbi:MAG: OmpA family protein [Bacteroidota bacterium]